MSASLKDELNFLYLQIVAWEENLRQAKKQDIYVPCDYLDFMYNTLSVMKKKYEEKYCLLLKIQELEQNYQLSQYDISNFLKREAEYIYNKKLIRQIIFRDQRFIKRLRKLLQLESVILLFWFIHSIFLSMYYFFVYFNLEMQELFIKNVVYRLNTFLFLLDNFSQKKGVVYE
jgi:hypothetical protein